MSLAVTLVTVSAAFVLVVVWIVDTWQARAATDRSRERVRLRSAATKRWARSDALLRRLPGIGRLADTIDQARLRLQLTDLLILTIVLGVIAYRVGRPLIGPTAASVAAPTLVPVLIWSVVGDLAHRQREAVLAQLPDLVMLLANAARAGLSATAALQYAADDIAEPISSELRQTVLAVEFGTSFPDALADLAQRLRMPDMAVITSAMAIQHGSGGDLVLLMTRLATGLESSARARREARSTVSGLKGQTYLTAGLGIGTVVLVNSTTDRGLEGALQLPLTAVMFWVSAVVLVVSVLIVRRIVRIES